MFDDTIRHQQSMPEIQVRSVARCAINYLLHESAVLRRDPVQHQIQIGLHRSVVPKDAISFFRPDDFARRDIPAETARQAQSLRFRQIGLASPQLLFCALALNRNRRQMRDLGDNLLMLWSRIAWFAREYG